MKQEYLSDDEIEQIKDFIHYKLSKEQKLLIDKLILNEELKKRYKLHGLCKECNQPNTYYDWCHLCNSKHFQQNFKNWTSGNSNVDKFIQESQISAKSYLETLEWIEYNEFENIEYIARGGFGIIYKAILKKGLMRSWDCKINQWIRREENKVVVLKYLNNSKDMTFEFLNEVILMIQ
jgi:hypothetical protein